MFKSRLNEVLFKIVSEIFFYRCIIFVFYVVIISPELIFANVKENIFNFTSLIIYISNGSPILH